MRYFLLLTLLFTTCLLNAQELDSAACADIKTGEFYVISGSDTCFISRTKDRQRESCGNSDEEYLLIVVWLSDRKYILRDIHYNPSTAPRVMRKDVVMKILEVGPDYHKVLSKSKGKPSAIMTVYCNKQKK